MKKRILFTAAALVCAANLTAQCLGVGSSTSSMSPEEMAAAAKAGVEYVEIGISGRGTVAEIREKALHAKRMADEAGLKVWSCHLPFSRKLDISVLNDSARMANLEFLTEMIAICGEVGPEKLVLHPSSEPIADGEREQRIRNSIASIGILRREAARIGAQLCIEDLPRTCLGRNSAELLRIIAPYPEGGENLFRHEPPAFGGPAALRRGVRRPDCDRPCLDYDMVDERHWLPGKGRIDWPALYGALMKADLQGVFMYELKRGEDRSAKWSPSTKSWPPTRRSWNNAAPEECEKKRLRQFVVTSFSEPRGHDPRPSDYES